MDTLSLNIETLKRAAGPVRMVVRGVIHTVIQRIYQSPVMIIIIRMYLI
jgi:hypothetical protein